MSIHHRLTVVLTLCTLLIAGCAGPRVSPEQRASLEAPARSLEARGEWREAALAWQQAADANPGDLGHAFRLNAADALLRKGDGPGAAAVVRKLPADLPSPLAVRRALTLGEIALATGDPVGALSQVAPAAAGTDPATLGRYRRVRAEALELTGDPLGAARELAMLGALLRDPEQVYRNHQKVWELLAQVPDEVLSALPTTPPQLESGWLELASIARQNRVDVTALEAAIGGWTLRYPGHPAGEQIVPELIEGVRADSTPPTKVALLLPQSGPFANAAAAVRDGFMAAWFADAPNPNRPEVILRDSATGDPALTYAGAIADGAQFMVGPLSKESVNAVLRGADLSVNTLTLNYPSIGDTELATTAGPGTTPGAPPTAGSTLDAASEAPVPTKDFSRVFHFALSPEDEAERAAEYAHARGARQAGLLVPDGEWGTRIAEAFTARFEALGGVIARSQTFPEEATGLSEAVEALLNIGQSKDRARALRGMLARDIKHEPEPRSDLDVVFLAAFPQTARQLRPLLLFHRADRVPVIATSHIYDGRPDPSADQDIEGVIFGDMPWLLDPDTYTLPGQVARIWPASGGTAGRLYAFGADAYALISRLAELRTSAAASHPGLTGVLSLGPERRIRRELDWAQVREGVPHRLDVDPTAAGGWGFASR